MSTLRELLSARFVLSALAFRDIRGQYRSTLLGQLWSLANPLTQMFVYTFVFSFVFRVQSAPGDPSGLDVYALYLLCGLIPWSLFQSAVLSGMSSLVVNANLINKVYFPRLIIPFAAIIATAYNSLFEFLVLTVALVVAGAFVLPWLPLALVLIIALLFFATGIALALSIANLHFRDTQYLVGVVFQVWMWMSPIIYPISLVEERSASVGPLWGTNITLLNIYELNPLVHFITVFRELMYDNRLPNVADSVACIVWALISLFFGLLIFRRNEKRLGGLL